MDASFGSRANSSYAWETRYGAYHWDSESGFYHVRNRYLHPKLGEWITRDSVGYKGGYNLYAYVSDNPVSFVDTSGLLKFVHCSEEDQLIIQALLSVAKDIANSPCFACCFGNPSTLQLLRRRINWQNLSIYCDQNSGACCGKCAYSTPFISSIHVCLPAAEGPKCPDLSCTILHEIVHIIGHWSQTLPNLATSCCEKCLH